MQYKPPYHESTSQNIMAVILQSLPGESHITKIEYEGPRIALYSKNPAYLIQNTQILSNMVNTIKKRIVVRTDESIRKSEEECIEILNKSIPNQVGIIEIFFDHALGEVEIFVEKPSLIANVGGEYASADLVGKIGWQIRIRKATQSMSIIRHINKILHDKTNERIHFYKEVGEKIFRSKLNDITEVSLITLGGFAEIGRSSMLLTTDESKILLDCGINMLGVDSLSVLPRFDIVGLKVNEIDAIVLIHVHIGNGDHNIVYTGDMKFGKTYSLENSSWNFPMVETMIIESTYGSKEDVFPRREEADVHLIDIINSTISENGKILFPVPAVGLSQELILSINMYMKAGRITETTVLIEKLISDSMSIYEAYPEYLSKEIKHILLGGEENPFRSRQFLIVESQILDNKVPAVIIAPSSMLTSGPSVDYLEQICEDPKNRLILSSFQAQGTPGRLIQDGSREVIINGENIRLDCQVERIEGFNTHSDY